LWAGLSQTRREGKRGVLGRQRYGYWLISETANAKLTCRRQEPGGFGVQAWLQRLIWHIGQAAVLCGNRVIRSSNSQTMEEE
jgi:hypothetical protein